MFKLFLAILGGAILLILALVMAFAVFLYRIRQTPPGATVGFSPRDLIQAPIIFVPMLLTFTAGFAATFFWLNHR